MIYVGHLHWRGLFHRRPLWLPETMFPTRFSSFPAWRVTMSVWQPWTYSSNFLALSSALTIASFSFVTYCICFLCVIQSVVSNSVTQETVACQALLLCPWDSPGKDTGVGCHFLLQGIFLTQESNPGLSCIAGRLFYWLSYEGRL